MKVAAPTSMGQIDPHFGHCAEFTIYTIAEDKKKISAEEKLIPPPECGCKSEIIPQLAGSGVTVMLAGNMGGGAVNMLNSQGIEVFRGLTGNVKEAVQAWLDGKVVDLGTDCGGSGGHDCGH